MTYTLGTVASAPNIIVMFVGLVIGGVGAIKAQGSGWVISLIGGVLGSFTGSFWFPVLILRISNLLLSTIIFGTIGAVILVVAVRLGR
jgi:uncharacterized membrane protein YeaQ/YmgE (transglycosylase-associated protein family)